MLTCRFQIRVGMSVGHSPSEPQWTPDMRKDDKEVTQAEKDDAKRRIRGAVEGEESPDESGGDDILPASSPQRPLPRDRRRLWLRNSSYCDDARSAGNDLRIGNKGPKVAGQR